MADSVGELVLELRRIRKDYGALRPLRIEHLELRQGQSLALIGFDAVAAELLVNLVTGATVPDEGDVRAFGESTRAITDGEAWLASLDRFGLLSCRAVLLDQLTLEQNLAVPFTLDLEAISESLHDQIVQLAEDVGLANEDLTRPVGGLPPATQLRVRLARAVALTPRILLAEHPTATLPADDVGPFAADLSRLIARRGLASLALTTDRVFASAVAEQVLTVQPATGELKPQPARSWLWRGRT
jgi:ABC-type transporter Mla maintaining outer membrane lipid asymmetry ATPase subunit MlaF